MASEKIKISTIEYPPLAIPNFVPGLGYGISCDLIIEAFKAVNTDVTFVFLPMIRGVWSVTEAKIYPANLGSINWFINDNKEHLVKTFDLIAFNFLFFYKKVRFPKGLSYKSLSELQQYKIGNVRGSSTTPLMEKANIRVDWSSNLEQNLRKLNKNRFDLAVSGDISGWNLIKDIFPDEVNDFATTQNPLLTIPSSLVFHRDETQLILEFTKGLNIILENGTYYEILKRYYGKDQITDKILPPYIKERIKMK